MHANHGRPIMAYLMKETRTHTEEAVRHGGCLGLGLAAMGTADEGGWCIRVEGCWEVNSFLSPPPQTRMIS